MGSEAEYHDKFTALKVCVLVPTYNNEATVAKVINDVLAYTQHVIVVNDGSTDRTSEIIKSIPGIHIVEYTPNRGKGCALRKGFDTAVDRGYDYAITIDSDGQHFATDLPAFIQSLETNGPSLIMGARNMEQAGVPAKSTFGNKFSSFWFRMETGIRLPDTQSGYRLYPVKLMRGTKYFTDKFEFEIEVIVRAAWSGINVVSVPVKVFYAPRESRISHFKPLKDSVRISLLNVVLVLITILYINPRDFLRHVFKKSTYQHLWHEVMSPADPAGLKAVSVGFGVFMGIFPVWGFQLVIAILVSVFFRLNKGLVILSAHISVPPMIPLIIYLSYRLGAVWMDDNALHLALSRNLDKDSIHLNFLQYLYGSIALSILAGVIAAVITYIFLIILRRSRRGG